MRIVGLVGNSNAAILSFHLWSHRARRSRLPRSIESMRWRGVLRLARAFLRSRMNAGCRAGAPFLSRRVNLGMSPPVGTPGEEVGPCKTLEASRGELRVTLRRGWNFRWPLLGEIWIMCEVRERTAGQFPPTPGVDVAWSPLAFPVSVTVAIRNACGVVCRYVCTTARKGALLRRIVWWGVLMCVPWIDFLNRGSAVAGS